MSELEALLALGWRFQRPTGPADAFSRHVFVHNVASYSPDQLHALAASFGELLRVTPTPPARGSAAAFAAAVFSYADDAGAAAAVAGLAGKLSARHARLQPPERAPVAPPPGACAEVAAEALRVPGLLLLCDFVTEAEERALLAHVDRRGASWQQLARRRVLHEGAAFDYAARAADAPAAPFGPPCAALGVRLAALPEVVACGSPPFDQLTVNEYGRGVGIPPHCDTHSPFGPVIAAVSLAGTAALVLRRTGHADRALFLPRRSCVLLTGEARYGWQHYVPARHGDVLVDGTAVPRGPRRVSFTFRACLPHPRACACAWPAECDTAQAAAAAARAARHVGDHLLLQPVEAAPPADIDADDTGRTVPALEVTHVRALYERIAPHFSATRHATWPAVRAFLAALPRGCLVLDVGCGNGKYAGAAAAAGAAWVGVDASKGLLRLCHRRGGGVGGGAAAGTDTVQGDCCALPCRSNGADAALCIAVLHHLSTPGRRRAALLELRRVLAPGGTALVTAWAVEQEAPEKTLARWERMGSEGTDYLVPWHLPLHRPEASATARAGEPAGLGGVVLEGKQAVLYRRFCHLFPAGELGALARGAGLEVSAEFYDSSNWCIRCRKPPA